MQTFSVTFAMLQRFKAQNYLLMLQVIIGKTYLT